METDSFFALAPALFFKYHFKCNTVCIHDIILWIFILFMKKILTIIWGNFQIGYFSFSVKLKIWHFLILKNLAITRKADKPYIPCHSKFSRLHVSYFIVTL